MDSLDAAGFSSFQGSRIRTPQNSYGIIAQIDIRDSAQKFRGRYKALVVPDTHNNRNRHNFASEVWELPSAAI